MMALGLVATGLAAGSPGISMAVLGDTDGAIGGLATDVLDPPVGPSAASGASVTVTWTPTADAYAEGHRILRSASSGGPWTQVGTTSPRTVGTFIDTPGASGQYWYVVDAYADAWTSAGTTPVSALVGGTTGFHACTAQAAASGGDGNGYETAAANACATDGLTATDLNSGTSTSTLCPNTGKDRHDFRAFGLGVPAGAGTIGGIAVRAVLRIDLVSGTNRLCALLSWDGGTSWTAAKSVAVAAATLTTYTLGGAADTWGRTWTAAQLSDASFRVRLVDVSSSTARDFFLDGVSVEVAWQP